MAKIPFDAIPILSNKEQTLPDELIAAFLLFDKPTGWSSFRAVKLCRWASQIKKVGHAGTLDPLATGLLVLGLGKATKHIETIQSDSKEYIATIRLGASTPSYDSETEIDATAEYKYVSLSQIEEAISSSFIGAIQQTPPMFSALKKDGKRLYTLARKGEKIELESRLIHIYSIDILSFDAPHLKLKVHCGKGTYIRSLAHDLAKKVGSLGHLTALRRTKIGNFNVEDALTEQQVKQLFGKND